MKRRGLWAAGVVLLVGFVAVLVVGTGFAKDENAGAKCSEATLHGTFLFAFYAVAIGGNEQVPFAEAGYEVYNGNGKVNGVFSSNFNGEITRKEPYSGTDTVEADCTGTVTYATGTQVDLFIAPMAVCSRSSMPSPPSLWGRGLHCGGRPNGLPIIIDRRSS